MTNEKIKLDEILNSVAQNSSYPSWDNLRDWCEKREYTNPEVLDRYIKQAMREAVRQALERAAENAEAKENFVKHPHGNLIPEITIDRDSITNTLKEVE